MFHRQYIAVRRFIIDGLTADQVAKETGFAKSTKLIIPRIIVVLTGSQKMPALKMNLKFLVGKRFYTDNKFVYTERGFHCGAF